MEKARKKTTTTTRRRRAKSPLRIGLRRHGLSSAPPAAARRREQWERLRARPPRRASLWRLASRRRRRPRGRGATQELSRRRLRRRFERPSAPGCAAAAAAPLPPLARPRRSIPLLLLLLCPRDQPRRAEGEEARAGLSTAGPRPGRGATRRPQTRPLAPRRCCSFGRKSGASARPAHPSLLLRRPSHPSLLLLRPSRFPSTTPGAGGRPRNSSFRPLRARGRRQGGRGRTEGAARRRGRPRRRRERSPRRERHPHPGPARLFLLRRRSGCSEQLLPCSMPERDEIELLS